MERSDVVLCPAPGGRGSATAVNAWISSLIANRPRRRKRDRSRQPDDRPGRGQRVNLKPWTRVPRRWHWMATVPSPSRSETSMLAPWRASPPSCTRTLRRANSRAACCALPTCSIDWTPDRPPHVERPVSWYRVMQLAYMRTEERVAITDTGAKPASISLARR